GNGDGVLDLYVSDAEFTGQSLTGKKGTVKRYDGATGAFIDTFVPEKSGGLVRPSMITFRGTDPVTLVYTGSTDSRSDAASPATLAHKSILVPVASTAISSITINSVASFALRHFGHAVAEPEARNIGARLPEIVDQVYTKAVRHGDWSPEADWNPELLTN